MFWVVADCSEYALSARLSLRVLRTRSLRCNWRPMLDHGHSGTPDVACSALPEVRKAFSLEPARTSRR